jgi:hypothetical protein
MSLPRPQDQCRQKNTAEVVREGQAIRNVDVGIKRTLRLELLTVDVSSVRTIRYAIVFTDYILIPKMHYFLTRDRIAVIVISTTSRAGT